MRIISITIMCLFVATAGFSQSAIVAVNISQKTQATVEDAVKLFMFSTVGSITVYEKDAPMLLEKGILPRLYDPNTPVTMGIVAYMMAKQANIKHSLMFNIFGGQRYAVFACIAAGYLPKNAGEQYKLSGVELIEIMGRFGGDE
ncbi:MAG TPA: hypothetical protein PLH80_09845 [Spirochaetota bacterium]|nr:hypothetical protein [Spirochaetota bacterium]